MVSIGTDRSRLDVETTLNAEGSDHKISIASRRAAFARLRSEFLKKMPAAVLLSGEGGAGKTWLWKQVFQSSPPTWRALTIDMTSALSASEFLLLIGEGLGVKPTAGVASSRIEIAAALREESTDGRSWFVILEDAQCAGSEIWEEVRVLANHLGEVGGFAGLLIVAQTDLVRRLSGRSLASVAGRLTDHVHLPPLDLDECRALISDSLSDEPERQHPQTLEAIHRDARGNSREILRLARRLAAPDRSLPKEPARAMANTDRESDVASRVQESVPSTPDAPTAPGAASIRQPLTEDRDAQIVGVTAAKPPAAKPSLSLLPSKPPIRLEDGLIEVGWQGEDSVEPHLAQKEDLAKTSQPLDSPRVTVTDLHSSGEEEAAVADPETAKPSEEWIEDPYAALQAWSEWARNRERISERPVELGLQSAVNESVATTAQIPEAEDEGELSPTGTSPGSTIRAEAQHEFSPYGQLFGETRRSKPA